MGRRGLEGLAADSLESGKGDDTSNPSLPLFVEREEVE